MTRSAVLQHPVTEPLCQEPWGRTDESPISQEEFQGKLEAIGMGS
jgi:hypothetical protein